MSDAELAELRAWAAEFAAAGHRQAVLVRALLGERDAYAAALVAAEVTHAEYARALAEKDELIRSLSDRVAAQSELLSRRADLSPP